MNTITRLVIPCRVILKSYVSFHHIAKQLKRSSFLISYNKVDSMAQRKLTSFFKLTPQKTDKRENKEEVKVSGDADSDSPTVTNTKNKASAKRARLDSSESDTSSQERQTSPVGGSDKKKKVKRQRIESSGSESEQLKKRNTGTDNDSERDNTIVKREVDSSPKSEENILKVEKAVSPKTYSSPASKKKKAALVDHNGAAKTPTVKAKKSPAKVSNKKDTSSAKQRTSLFKIKQEADDKNEDKKKDVMSIKEEEKEIKSETKGLVKGSEYNPAKSKYHPIEDACWSSGAEVPYLALARTLELIESTSARLKIIEILSNYLRSVIVLTPEDLLPSIYLCLNQLAPAYHSLELGIAETYLMKAIAQCTGRTLAHVRAAHARCGDLGRVAQQARAAQRTMRAPPALTVRSVFGALKEIAHVTGQASVNKKINKIQSLYVACRHSEARYLIRSLEGKLRIGLAEQSVLHALALAAATTPPPCGGELLLDASKGMSPEEFKAVVEEHVASVKRAYCACPNYERLVAALLQHGARALPAHCRLTAGVPLRPMLAHPTRAVGDVFDRFEKEQFTCEWKYDGERAQIHVPGDSEGLRPHLERAAIFSRNQEDNTSKYPDVLRRLPELLKESVWSCVLDCEAVAYDTQTKQILPFQVLSTRKRKDAREGDIKVQVCVFVFDLLYLNGRPLVHEPLCTRRHLLREHFREHPGSWQFATSKDCGSVEEVQQFLEEAVRGSCEGLMVKALTGDNARYDIARRSHNWLKLKKDYLDGVGDTIDVVVIGAYTGRGKRSGTFGGFLLACYDPETEEYQSLCKIGTGFSDEDLQSLTATLKEHVIEAPRNYYRYDASHAADAWVEARCVWEVRGADLSLSGAHRAALGRVAPDRGVSLRFPRFIRVRDDKTPEQATSAQQIASMYLAQDQVKNTKSNKQDNLDDFY